MGPFGTSISTCNFVNNSKVEPRFMMVFWVKIVLIKFYEYESW